MGAMESMGVQRHLTRAETLWSQRIQEQVVFPAWKLTLAWNSALYLCRLGVSLAQIHRGLASLHQQELRRLCNSQMSRNEARELAARYGDVAAKLFQLAENDSKIVEKINALPELRDSGLLRFSSWCQIKMALYHEKVGCIEEDFAETLALSASESFAALVRQELDDCA